MTSNTTVTDGRNPTTGGNSTITKITQSGELVSGSDRTVRPRIVVSDIKKHSATTSAST